MLNIIAKPTIIGCVIADPLDVNPLLVVDPCFSFHFQWLTTKTNKMNTIETIIINYLMKFKVIYGYV